tara:strand:+ start:20 stop:145 length:126 start_codon:yes stop_codon:yes gene_type:complete
MTSSFLNIKALEQRHSCEGSAKGIPMEESGYVLKPITFIYG